MTTPLKVISYIDEEVNSITFLSLSTATTGVSLKMLEVDI